MLDSAVVHGEDDVEGHEDDGFEGMKRVKTLELKNGICWNFGVVHIYGFRNAFSMEKLFLNVNDFPQQLKFIPKSDQSAKNGV